MKLALPKGEGGLNLMGVEAQYHALSANFMLWLMKQDHHPLRAILWGHIGQASQRRWGTRDLTWLFSKCGAIRLQGSAPWLNICKPGVEYTETMAEARASSESGWLESPSPLEATLKPRKSVAVRCSTIAQRSLRDSGICLMADVLRPSGEFISWEEAI